MEQPPKLKYPTSVNSANGKIVNLQLTGRIQNTTKHVPKQYFRSGKIQYNEKCIGHTVWIPKADIRMPQPRLCLTLILNDERLRIYTQDSEELIAVFEKITAELHAQRKSIDKSLLEAKKEWNDIKFAVANATANN
jgi:hypothetical protein